MSQEQVDEWSNRFAEKHYVRISDTEYAAIPREARGIPHYTVPGVHAYLNDYADAMEHARTLLDITSKRTVDSLQCLSFGPFAERQSPHVAEGSGNFYATRMHTSMHTVTREPCAQIRRPRSASVTRRIRWTRRAAPSK